MFGRLIDTLRAKSNDSLNNEVEREAANALQNMSNQVEHR